MSCSLSSCRNCSRSSFIPLFYPIFPFVAIPPEQLPPRLSKLPHVPDPFRLFMILDIPKRTYACFLNRVQGMISSYYHLSNPWT